MVSNTWNNADCDGDGVINQNEKNDFTNPLNPCDFLIGSQTILPNDIWNNLDCDGDGVTNGDEINDNTNPKFSCDLFSKL